MASPIFVVGSDRSGTTLLRLMLTCHPKIAIPPESLFALKLYPAWGTVLLERGEQIETLCNELYGDDRFREWRVERRRLEQAIMDRLPLSFADLVRLVYETYAQQHQPTATRWGDKNPRYAMHLAWLWSLYPDARVLHVVRDGRAVFNSFVDANRKAGSIIWPEETSAAARSWTRRLTKARQHQSNPKYREIFYEELVKSPETELGQICEFVDLAYDATMLDFAEVNRRDQLVPKHRTAWHDATLMPVQDSRVAAWQRMLSPLQIARFELMAGHHLLSCGYPLHTSKLGRFRVVNSLVLYGATFLRKVLGMHV